jgi:hypothetical protein
MGGIISKWNLRKYCNLDDYQLLKWDLVHGVGYSEIQKQVLNSWIVRRTDFISIAYYVQIQSETWKMMFILWINDNFAIANSAAVHSNEQINLYLCIHAVNISSHFHG